MLFNNRPSIKSEFFHLGFLFFLLILLAFGILMSLSLLTQGMEKGRIYVREANRQVSDFAEGYFSEIARSIEVLSRDPAIIAAGTGDEAAKQRTLATYLDYSTVYSDIAYIYSGYETGMLVINDYVPPPGYDPTDRPWYIAALEKKPQVSAGLPYREAVTDELLLSQSKVLKNSSGNVAGVIAIDVSLEGIARLLGKKHEYNSQQSFVLDREGTVIIHPDEGRVGRKMPEMKQHITGTRGRVEFSNEGTTKWGYYNTIDSTDWIIITTVQRREVLSPLVARIVIYLSSVALLAAGLGLLQSKLFARRFADPLTELGKRVSAISSGRLLPETSYQYSNPEIAAIASNIERLAEDSLTRRANELQTIIESTHDGILVVSDRREIIYVNTKFKEMWRIPAGVAQSASSDEDYFQAVADQLKDPQSFLGKTEELHLSDRDEVDTFYFQDGRVFEQYTCPIMDQGRVAGRLWSFGDITRRKQAEQKIISYIRELELKNIELQELYRHLDQEIDKARHIHALTLPDSLPRIPGLVFAAHYQPALPLGGDFYDLIQADRQLVIYLSDVSGHGLDGAMLSVFVKETIDSYVSLKPGQLQPALILQHLDSQFRKKNYPPDYFISIFLAVFDLETRTLSYGGAGCQVFPLLQRGSGDRELLACDGLPVAAVFPSELMNFQEHRVQLDPGATLLFSTDGLFEHSIDGFRYQQRVEKVFYDHVHLLPLSIVQAINEDFCHFSAGSLKHEDDITFLVMQVEQQGEGTATG